MNKQPPSKKKYNRNYIKSNCKHVVLMFNKKTDADIIEHLQTKENKSAYIKKLIRNDM